MSKPISFCHNSQATNEPTKTSTATGDIFQQPAVDGADPLTPILLNLFTIQAKMESLQQFLSIPFNTNTLLSKDQMQIASTEIASALNQIILNGTALLSTFHHHPTVQTQLQRISQEPPNTAKSPTTTTGSNVKSFMYPFENEVREKGSEDLYFDTNKEREFEDRNVEIANYEWEIVELSAAQLLGERKHYCELCRKEFKRYANLRIHIRSHGNKFKESTGLKKKTRFSCPFKGCDRNKLHIKFRPLQSVVCAKNHFRRSHCPKMYSCTRCDHRKSFSVLADLKTHLKHCGESKWVGNMKEENKTKGLLSTMAEDGENGEDQMGNCCEDGFILGLLEEFGSIDKYFWEDSLGSPSS